MWRKFCLLLIRTVCRLAPGYRWLDRILLPKGFHREADGWYENSRFEIAPSPWWNPKAFDVYEKPDQKWVGWTLFEGLDLLDEGIGLFEKVSDDAST